MRPSGIPVIALLLGFFVLGPLSLKSSYRSTNLMLVKSCCTN
jgi:hypothetical protein